ncbi:UNVERIFIED_CONTAM: putative mitochondrial protein [Sesamum radiatum]|uniref:Mitochondrial protein n=1 Tax=Sesamum radiatum TaxID=300843 RepID=A0AAW2IPB8_SESRA
MDCAGLASYSYGWDVRPTRQVKRKGSRKTFCYDLSAATDRWPLVVLFEVFQNLFDRSFASAVVNSALACNIFEVPFSRRRQSSVSFVTGQPLGYYASWPLFIITPFMVWYAAERVYPG